MADWGIKVSKPTKSITSSTPEDYIFNSKFGSAIIYKDAEVSVTIAAGGTTKSTVNYYLPDGTTPLTFDYYPVVLIFAELVPGSGEWYLSPFTLYETIDTFVSAGIYTLPIYTAVEKSKFFITFYNRTGSSITMKYHYYLFANLG
jgi:hypothetical protein